MKIILYCPGLVKGGTERVLTNLANELDNDKFDVTIITNILHEPEYKLNRNIKCKSLDNKKVNSFYRKLRKFSIGGSYGNQTRSIFAATYLIYVEWTSKSHYRHSQMWKIIFVKHLIP